MQAFGQANPTQVTYPIELRPFLEVVLEQHFDSLGGSSHPVGRGISVTEATRRRCNRGSIRATTCDECKGTKKQTIRTTKRDIEIPCPACFGAGEFGTHVKPSVGVCTKCNGGGRYRPEKVWAPTRLLLRQMAERLEAIKGDRTVDPHRELGKLYRLGKKRPLLNVARRDNCPGQFRWVQGKRVWNDNPDHDPYHELAQCTACRGSGWDGGLDAQPIAPDEGGGAIPSWERRSHVGDVLLELESSGAWEARTVLELAYGEVGRYVTKRLGEPRTLALWAATKPGSALMSHLMLPDNRRPHKALAQARASSDLVVATMVRAAETASVALLERAWTQLCAADGEGDIRRLADRLSTKGALWM